MADVRTPYIRQVARSPAIAGSKTPDQRLRQEMLNQAIRDLVKPSAKVTIQERQEVREWFLSDADEGPFTFVAVCTALGLSPSAVRAKYAGLLG